GRQPHGDDLHLPEVLAVPLVEPAWSFPRWDLARRCRVRLRDEVVDDLGQGRKLVHRRVPNSVRAELAWEIRECLRDELRGGTMRHRLLGLCPGLLGVELEGADAQPLAERTELGR